MGQWAPKYVRVFYIETLDRESERERESACVRACVCVRAHFVGLICNSCTKELLQLNFWASSVKWWTVICSIKNLYLPLNIRIVIQLTFGKDLAVKKNISSCSNKLEPSHALDNLIFPSYCLNKIFKHTMVNNSASRLWISNSSVGAY
jgi:hypothetical protein